MNRARAASLLVVMALVGSACGGRLTDEQISAERAADAAAAGAVSVGAGGALGAPGSSGLGLTGPGEILDPSISLPGATAGSSSGSAGSTSAGSSGGTSNGTGGGGPGGGSTSANAGTAYAFTGDNGGASDVGITATEVVIGNVATLSGPVPGLFRGALVGTQAYLERENARGGYFGRRYRVESGDDGFDAGKNRAAHKSLASKVFAFVGSFSTADGAGASEMEAAGAPDIGRPLAQARFDNPFHRSMLPLERGWGSTAPEYFNERFPDIDFTNVAFMWAAVDAARENAAWFMNAAEKAGGWEFTYTREVQATESNFTADIIEMQRRGIEAVMYLGDITAQVRIWKTMHDQNYDPELKYSIATAYDSSFVRLLGNPEAAEDTIISQNVTAYLGGDAALVPEVAEFRTWMDRIDPNQTKDLFAFYGWISAKLLVRALHDAGPAPTRESVLAAIDRIGEYDSDGMTETVNIGKRSYPRNCELFITVKAGEFQRFHPARGFHCQGRFVPEA